MCIYIEFCVFIFLFFWANPEDVVQRIKEAGFKIQFEKEVTLTKDLASQFYQEHEGKDFFEGLTDHMARYEHITSYSDILHVFNILSILSVRLTDFEAFLGLTEHSD